MSGNRPPMTVWLAFNAVDCFERNEDCGASDLKNHHHKIGPYVNLEQFLAEAKKRSKKTNRFLPEIIEIMQKEINEQTIPATIPPKTRTEIHRLGGPVS